MTDNWVKLDEKKTAKIMQDVNKYIQPVAFDESATIVRSQMLPFYQGYEFLELTDMSTNPAAKKFAICKEGAVSVIDWTNEVIYAVNEKAPIRLDEKNVVAYIKFFFNYVTGRHGKFAIVETVDDIKWQVEPPMQGRKIMQEMLGPVSIVNKNADGSFDLMAQMMFKDSLFKASIHVDKKGYIEMSQEELKIEGMPVLQDYI